MYRLYIRSLLRALLCVFAVYGLAQADESVRLVRVGFFPMEGFHGYDMSGDPIGYDVDYLRKIDKYTGWKYRFIRSDSWDEALEQLARGEIDLVGSAQLSAERLERFDYSAYSTGITYGALIVLSGNSKLEYEAFDSFINMHIGCVKSYVRKDAFLTYAHENGFTPNLVWFDTTEQMRKALHAREIDAMVCSVMEIAKKEKVVAEFFPAPFHYIVRKGNVELLSQLNEAIARIKIDSPTFETELMDTWYPVSRIPSFTKKERAYVRENPLLRVGFLVNRPPLSGTANEDEHGPFVGAIPDIMELVAREAGLSIVQVPIPKGSHPLQLLEQKHADAVAGLVAFEEQLRDPRLRLSEPFLVGHIIAIVRHGEPFIASMPLKAALPGGFLAGKDFIQTRYPHFSIVEYFDTKECLDAVQRGDADITVQNTHVLERLMHGPRYAELMVLPRVSEPEKLVVALPAESDPRLLSLLDKSIKRVPSGTIDQIVINHTVATPYSITLIDFFHQYRSEILWGGALSGLSLFLFACYICQRRKNIEIIKESEATLRNITSNINGGVITLIADKGFTILYANNGFLELVGYTREQYDDSPAQECITYVHPDDVPRLNEAVSSKHRSGDTMSVEMRILQKDGNYVPVMFRGTLAQDRDKRLILFCVVVDISEQHAMIENLKIEKERYQIVVEQSNDIIFEVDMQQQTLLCSPKFKEKFGWQMDKSCITQDNPYNLQVHPDDASTLQEIAQRILLGECSQSRQLRIRKVDGEYLWCRLLVSSVRRGSTLVKLIGKIEDVDDVVRERMRLEEMARTDALCGLFNKRALHMAIEHRLRLIENHNGKGVMFFLDLDNFKAINDNMGHSMGDQVLREVASTLRALFRAEDIMGRFGGDEFCIFASNLPDEMITFKAEEIVDRLRRTYRSTSAAVSVDISVSVGIACFPTDSTSCDGLMMRADQALYLAKSLGRDRYVMFDAQTCEAAFRESDARCVNVK